MLDTGKSTIKKNILMAVIVICFCFVTLSGWAATYVSDKLEVPLRTGPGPREKIVGMLQSGQTVEVVSEENGWSNVRSVGGNSDNTGWILSRYLMNREPWENHVHRLERDNAALREQVAPLTERVQDIKSKNSDLTAALQEKTNELESLKNRYASLSKDASGVLELRQRFQETQSNLTHAEAELAQISEENNLLRSSHRSRWFLTGALVLLAGLLIGLLIGRRDKKRRSSISF
jgi:SH3 domain protein